MVLRQIPAVQAQEQAALRQEPRQQKAVGAGQAQAQAATAQEAAGEQGARPTAPRAQSPAPSQRMTYSRVPAAEGAEEMEASKGVMARREARRFIWKRLL